MKTATEVLDEHCLIGDSGLKAAIILAMESYANQRIVIQGTDLQKVLDKNCSEFDDNIIT